MFTGIITDVGHVRSIARDGDTRFEIATAFDTSDIAIGASIACSGPCLTVVDKGTGWFAVEASAETMARTTLSRWQEGTRINLERSLKLGDELGGHLLFGHADGVAEIAARRPEGENLRLAFRPPGDLLPFVAVKGSVQLPGARKRVG